MHADLRGTDFAGLPVLLTGHTGFKGAWLALWLQQLGAKVTGYALPPPTEPSLFELARVGELVDSHLGDVRDLPQLQAVFAQAQPQLVLHLAAQALVRPSYADPVGTFSSNVMGTVHVLEAARQCPSVRAVVVVTSDKCYDNREWLWGYRENEALGGRDPYSASKGCAEIVTAAYRQSFFGSECLVASARAGNVFGGGDWAADRLVPDILKAFAAGVPAQIRRPDAVRPWQHVLEPLAGYVRLAQRLLQGDAACADAFNFGPAAGSELPVRHIAERLRDRWPGAQLDIAAAVSGPHEAGLLRLDAAKARAVLGWHPRLPLAEALQWTVDWQRQVLADPAAARDVTQQQIRAYAQLAG